MKTTYILATLLIIGILIFSGCCGSTGPSSSAPPKEDPYQKYYGTEAKVGSTYSLKFEKYQEKVDSDGTKTVTLTLRVTNSGTEEESVANGLFITDENGRNFEANPFACSTLVNPGLSKQVDCAFYDVPPASKIVALKVGDSVFDKGKYTTLMAFE